MALKLEISLQICDFFLLVLESMKSLQQSRTKFNIHKTGDELEERNKGDSRVSAKKKKKHK